MRFVFHPEAENELNEAIDYYEGIEPLLGYDFSLEVYSSIQLAIKFPRAWPVIENDIRRVLLNRFPFGVLYIYNNNMIYIIAIMNLHRNPDYWKARK